MVKMVLSQNASSKISEKHGVKQTCTTKESWRQWRLFGVESRALSLPKLENCVHTQLGEYRHWRQEVIIIDKPFLTLGWKSRATGCIFDPSYSLLNASFESKMVINRYLRCLFGNKKVIHCSWNIEIILYWLFYIVHFKLCQ